MEKWDDDTFKLPNYHCLDCGREMDAATTVPGLNEDAEPHPGAVSLCLQCGNVAIFADDMTLRPLTDDEVVDLAGDESFKRMMRVHSDYRVWRAKREKAADKYGIVDPKKLRFVSDDGRICGYEADDKYMVAVERRNGRIKRIKFASAEAAQVAIAAMLFAEKLGEAP